MSALDPDRYRLPPGSAVDLRVHPTEPPEDHPGGKREARRRLEVLQDELRTCQRMLWADGRHRLLVVLQAMDTGGKDGTIRNVFGVMNPQGVDVTGFKVPTPEELAHDYLWRVHPHVPGDGEIAVFNRSHYEDVLVVRVLGLASEERWRRRYGHIVAFEQMLVDEGTTILKFFLHISPREQRERLQARLDDPTKHWKFSPADLDHRRRWEDYEAAYEEAIARTSTDAAPWYIVPSDRKWYRNLVVAEAVIQTMKRMGLSYPESEDDLTNVTID